MGVIQKQSISGVILSYVGVGLGFLTTAILFTRLLEKEEIGMLRLMVSYSSIMTMFGSLGMNVVTVKLFPHFRNEKDKHHGFLGIALLVVLLGFVISTAVYILLKNSLLEGAEEKSSLFTPFFYVVIPLTLFSILFSVLDTYYRVLYNAVKGIIYKEIYQRLFIILAILAYYLRIIDFPVFVSFYVLAFFLPVILFVFSLIREKGFFLKPDFAFINVALRKEMMSVAFFGILAGFSGILVQSIDVIMINRFLGLGPAGIYTICFFFGTLILIPMRTMAKIGSVVIAQAWKDDDLKTISDVYQKSSLTLSVVGVLFFIGIWGNIDNIFQLIGSAYAEGRYVIFFIGLANVAEIVTGMSGHIILNSKYYRWQTYLLVIFAVLIVVTNLLLIPIYGIVGAALASFISKLIHSFMRVAFIRTKFRMQPFSIQHLLLLIITAIVWWASTFIPQLPNYMVDIVVRSLAITLMFGLLVYFLRISKDINDRIDAVFQLIIRKFN